MRTVMRLVTKLALTVLAALTLFGCSHEPLPSPPITPAAPSAPGAPAPQQLTYVLGKVVDETNACILGAAVHVVRGQRAGKSLTQSTPCDVWSYEEGFSFEELTPGVEMTLRASASGYVPEEKTIVPHLGEQHFVVLVLSRLK